MNKYPLWLDSIKKKDFRFTDFPKKQSLNDYEEAKKFFLDHISNSNDVDSIYLIGEISMIGMSDLDFIVVLKQEQKNVEKTMKLIQQTMQKYPYLIIHYPLVITRKNFENINYLFPIFSLSKLYGNDYTIKKVTNQKILSAITLNDYITFHWPREFMRYFLVKKVRMHNKKISYIVNQLSRIFWLNPGKREIPVRTILCRLNSMKYPLKILKNLTGKKYSCWEKYIQEIQDLRNNWFTLPESKFDTMIKKLKENIYFTTFLIEELDKYYRENEIFKGFRNKEKFLEKEHSCIFNQNWEMKNSIEKTARIFRRTKEVVSILPMSFFYQRIFLYNIMKNKKQDPSTKIDEEYKKILEIRYNLYKEEIDFLNNNKFTFKPIIKYDYLTTKPFLYKIYLKFSKIMRNIKI